MPVLQLLTTAILSDVNSASFTFFASIRHDVDMLLQLFTMEFNAVFDCVVHTS